MKSPGKSFLRSGGLRRAAALALGLPVLLSTVAIAPANAVPREASPVAGVAQKNLDPSNYKDGRYIVVLAEKPAATYDGGTDGLPATKPESGRKLDANKSEVKKYQAHLEKKQSEVAGQQHVRMQHQFTAAINGFSAKLTADQAIKLAKDPDVLLVAPDTENAPDYSSTDFLKLSGATGSWNTKFGGQDAGGKGVVVGVIDTGYTPSSAFFAGAPVQPLTGDPVVGVPYRNADGKISMLKADGETFTGDCQGRRGGSTARPVTPRSSAPATSPMNSSLTSVLLTVRRKNCSPRSTSPATARTRPARPPATPMSRQKWTAAASA